MLTAPQLSYSLLAPILIVLGGALIGVLVEAIVKPASRAAIQTAIALGTIVLSFAFLFKVHNQTSKTAAVNSVSFDGVGIFLQGTILILSFIALLYIADTDNFAAQASAVPGSVRRASCKPIGQAADRSLPTYSLFSSRNAALPNRYRPHYSICGIRNALPSAVFDGWTLSPPQTPFSRSSA
jgi:hypothetical protein